MNSSSSPLSFGQSDMDTAISSLGSLTNHGNQWGAMNISKMSDTYLKDIMENPSLENIMKTVASFQGEDFEGNDELKEIQDVI